MRTPHLHSPSPARFLRVGVGFWLFLSGCETEASWVRFNAEDALSVEITAEEVGEAVSAELHSTSGQVVVGAITVDPGAGPVGTLHTVTVEILDDWEEVVGKVTLSTDSGARGIEEHELVRDSADHGFWSRELRSEGADGEVRTDRFSALLWRDEAVAVEEY